MLFQVCGRFSVIHAVSLKPGASAPAASALLNFQLESMFTSMRFEGGGGGPLPPAPPTPLPPAPLPPMPPVGSPPMPVVVLAPGPLVVVASPVELVVPVDVSPVVE